MANSATSDLYSLIINKAETWIEKQASSLCIYIQTVNGLRHFRLNLSTICIFYFPRSQTERRGYCAPNSIRLCALWATFYPFSMWTSKVHSRTTTFKVRLLHGERFKAQSIFISTLLNVGTQCRQLVWFSTVFSLTAVLLSDGCE